MLEKDELATSEETKYSAPALSKGLDILELLAEQSQGLKKAEIAAALERSISEIYRMLMVLQERGFVMLDVRSERYSLTMRMFRLAHKHPPINRLTELAGDVMSRLAVSLNQSIHLAIQDKNHILVIAQTDPPGNNITLVRMGARVPIPMTASGACLVYTHSDEDLTKIKNAFPDLDQRTISNFDSSIAQVKEGGVCEIPSAVIENVYNVSVPVHSFRSKVEVALSVPYVRRLTNPEDPGIPETKQQLIEAGQYMSEMLGASTAE